jgi:single-stranded DNA-binding protein
VPATPETAVIRASVKSTAKTGNAMVTVSVAVDAARPGDDPATEWINVGAFGQVVEELARHVKGDPVSAMGALHRARFQSQDGQQRETWSLTAESILSARAPCDLVAVKKRSATQRPARSARPRPHRDGPPLADDPIAGLWSSGAP